MSSPRIISSFRGQYEFLSNFFPWPFEYDGFVWKSSEHAFQAAKTLDRGEQQTIRLAYTAGGAKREGRKVELRPDWEHVKLEIMEDILRAKFTGTLRTMLLRTEDAVLVEGNTWGDTYWGKCNGVGENHLGKLLMKLREEFKGGRNG